MRAPARDNGVVGSEEVESEFAKERILIVFRVRLKRSLPRILGRGEGIGAEYSGSARVDARNGERPTGPWLHAGYFGAGLVSGWATSFWKRGSFRSGSHC